MVDARGSTVATKNAMTNAVLSSRMKLEDLRLLRDLV